MTAARLYLIRHAIAAERGSEWPDDGKRPLTSKGRARMRAAVRGFAELGVHLDVVLTSPLVRAVQTAEIVVAGLSPKPALAETPALEPDAAPAAVAAALRPHRRVRAVALVGHEPGIGTLAGWLLGAAHPVEFKKGAICCLESPLPPGDGSGRLLWHATPAMLRALGK
jgi:phosphohistidine phosphatase